MEIQETRFVASTFVNIISDPITVADANYAVLEYVLEVREVDISDSEIIFGA